MEHPVIVISDDDPQMVRSLARQATRAGLWAVPDLTSNVRSLAQTLHPALVVLDLQQQRDGIELLRELKSDPSTSDIRVVVLSAITDPDVREQCLSEGASEFVLKPFDPTFVVRLARDAAEIQCQRHVKNRAPAAL